MGESPMRVLRRERAVQAEGQRLAGGVVAENLAQDSVG